MMYCFHYGRLSFGCSLCGFCDTVVLFCLPLPSPPTSFTNAHANVHARNVHATISGLSGARAEQHRVFLLVCGLRRVKDPLYLAEVFTGTPGCSLHHKLSTAWNNSKTLRRNRT